jgi:hypothetical protein
MTDKEAMAKELEELAGRFSEGWHEGIKIDASDIMLLSQAAEALAQPEQEPVAWIHIDPDKPKVKFLEWKENEHGYRGRWIKKPLYLHPPQRTEQNFCPRCGKRTNDIHTCTPPREGT